MNNGEKPGRLSRYNTRRSSIGEGHKPYEHMLLKELPGKIIIVFKLVLEALDVFTTKASYLQSVTNYVDR